MRKCIPAVLFTAFILTALPCFAGQKPTEVIRTAVDGIIAVLKDPAFTEEDRKAEQAEIIIRKVRGILDIDELSRRTVGRPWKTFTPEQQADFTEAFADLLSATYMDRIQGFSDEKVAYVGERQGNRGRVEVQTKIIRSDGAEIPINYRMIENGEWRVYDVIIEGLSLVRNYNSQFQSILLKDGPDVLIQRVKDKAYGTSG